MERGSGWQPEAFTAVKKSEKKSILVFTGRNFYFHGKKILPPPPILWQKNDPYSRLNNKGRLVNTNIDQIYPKVTIYRFHLLVF